MAHDVFISHSVKNKTTADAVCAMLESEGVRCWIAPRDVTPGLPWAKSIVEAIEQSRVMVVLLTADANASPQVVREVERAVNHKVAILTLRIEDVLPTQELEYFLSSVHWLDALTPPLQAHLKHLAETIKLLLVRMDPGAAPPDDLPPLPPAAPSGIRYNLPQRSAGRPGRRPPTLPKTTTRHKNHAMVCGIGDVGMQLVQNFRAAGEDVVAVDLFGDSPAAATCEQIGVPVIQGDAKFPQLLLTAGVRQAKAAFVTTGSDSENMDIALQIQAIFESETERKQGRIQVLTEMRDDWMQKSLIASRQYPGGSAAADLIFFNRFTDTARMLISRLRLPPGPEFASHTFVLIGFGMYGREIVLHLIRACPVELGATLRILVFDERADEAKERFSASHPAAEALASLEFVAASISEGSPDMARIVEPKLKSVGPLLGVALAVGDDQVTLRAALEMRALLDRQGSYAAQVYVRLDRYRRLGEWVRDVETIAGFRDRLQIFGTMEETLSAEVLLESKLDRLARTLHADYLKQPKGARNPTADVEWRRLPEFYKMANRWRADHTPLLFELAGMHVQDSASPAVVELDDEKIGLLARLEHRRYTIERRLNENRPRAEWQDDPNLIDWDSLDDAIKRWNRQEVALLPQIVAELGIELLPARTLPLYGRRLAATVEEIDHLASDGQRVHCNLIVDLDEPEAVRMAARALALPSVEVWLISSQVPPEFSLRKQNWQPERAEVIRRASGWAARDRVALV